MSRFQCFIGKCQRLKMARFRSIAILIRSQKLLELVSSIQHWPKNMLEMFSYSTLVFDHLTKFYFNST